MIGSDNEALRTNRAVLAGVTAIVPRLQSWVRTDGPLPAILRSRGFDQSGVPLALRRTGGSALRWTRRRTVSWRAGHPGGVASGKGGAASRGSGAGLARAAARRLCVAPLALGCTLLGGCIAINEAKYTFHENGTGEAEYGTVFDAEMVLATETGPCQWSLAEETDHRIEIIEDNVTDTTRRGEWVRCTYRLGPIPSEELLQRILDGRGFGELRRRWSSWTLELDALDSKQVLENAGYCDGRPCPGFEFTLMEFAYLEAYAKPSERSTPDAPRTKFDDFVARSFRCLVELAGDGLDSVEGIALDESDGVYRFDGDCRTYAGTPVKWSVER